MKSGKYNGRGRQSISGDIDFLDAYLSLYSKEVMKENWKERAENFITLVTIFFGLLFITKLAMEIGIYLANK